MLSRLLGMRLFDVEASSRCNVSCLFCSRGKLPDTGLLDKDTFDRFLGHVPLRTTDGLMFVGMGEPLLNPHLPDFIASAKRTCPGIFTLVATNGTLLTPRILDRLLEAGLDTLEVSFNGITAPEYERLMRGARFDITLDNIRHAIRGIDRIRSRTKLQISYILTAENAEGRPAIEAFWRSRGIEHFRVQMMHTRGGHTTVPGMRPPDEPGLGSRRCEKFLFMPFITWCGDVLYCSHDLMRTHTLGNIREQAWTDIELRRQEVLRLGQWPDMCALCADASRHQLGRDLSIGVVRELARRLSLGMAGLKGALRRLAPARSAGPLP